MESGASARWRGWVAAVLLCLGGLPLGGQAQPAADEVPALRLNCGGIGLEESQRMRAEISVHALTLFFATEAGEFLAGVRTRIEDPLSGVRVEAICGPFGQVDVVEAGQYRIIAEHEGQRQELWVELVPQAGAWQALRWPR